MKAKLLTNRLLQKLWVCIVCITCCINANATNVSGNQFGTWTKANSPYVINGSVVVPAGKKLIIQPGVEVRSLNFSDKFEVDGFLYAVGTAADSIRFNGFANSGLNPLSTHGGLLYLNSSNNTDSTVLAFVSMNKWGDKDYYTGDQAAIEIGAGTVVIRNSLIANSELMGIYGYNDLLKVPTITGDVFVNNPMPLRLYTDNVGGISGCTNAIINLQGGYWTRNSTIAKPGPGSYYIFDIGSQHEFADAKLTIQAGVEIRSMDYSNRLTISGAGVMSAKGTAVDSIKFRGFPNPSVDPKSSHGGFIYINSASTTDSTVMSFVSMDKMGDKDYYTGDQAALELGNGIFVMRNSTISNSELQGIWGYGDLAAVPVIANVTFVNDPVPMRLYTDNVGSITNCTNAVTNLQGGYWTRNSTISKPGPGSYYIFDKASQHEFADAKLTIQAGVEIRSMSYADRLTISGNGRLSAVGTAADSIRFKGFADTSVAKSSHGGFIYINSASTTDSSVMSYISMNKMGDKDYYTGDQAAIELGNGIFILRNSLVSNSEAQAIWGYGDLNVVPVISGVTFINNPVPVRLYTDNVGGITNCNNAIINLQGGYWTRNSTISKPGLGSFYIFDQSSQHEFADAKLTIQPGVEIHSMSYADRLTISGTGVLYAKGTEADSIWFKGYANPTIAAASTHGGFIAINSGSTTDSSIFAYVGMDRMGDKDYYTGDQTAFELEAGRVHINNSSIRNSELRGIFGYGDASKLLVLKTNIFNNVNGAVFSSGSPVFKRCNIYGNSAFGINNLSTTVKDTVDARTCWWGDSTGPKQTQTNPNGKGNTVSKKVLYSPWLRWPYQVNDLGVTAVLTPVTGCSLTSAEQVKTRITNYGSRTQSGFNISYKINNGPVVTESVGALSLASDSVATFIFATKADLSTPGTTYNIRVFTALTGDTITVNDSATTVVINRKPNLGKDTTVKICAGSYTNIGALFNTASYVQPVNWSTTRPDSAVAGSYTLSVTNNFGCMDTAAITVANNPKPSLGKDTTVKICAGSFTSLTKLYDTTGNTVKWNTTRPDSVVKGSYTLIVTNSFGCKDTAAITVANNPKPSLGADTTVKICTGSFTSIRALYDTTGYKTIKFNTTTPDSVGKGTYRLIVSNAQGCTDTASIKVDTLPSPVKPVISQTGNTTFCLGDSLKLSTTATGTLQWYRNNSSIKKATTKTYTVKLAGSYKLQLSNAGSCAVYSDSVTVSVTQVAKPTITLVGDSLVSSAGAGNQWFESSVIIPGATTRRYSPDNIDVYEVQVTNGGCKSPMSDDFFYTANTLLKTKGFGSGKMQAQMYPNPAVNEANLLVTGQGGKIAVTITDASGKTVLKTEGLYNRVLKLPVQNLASGIYIVTISDGKVMKAMKFIKGN